MPREIVHWEILLSCIAEIDAISPRMGNALAHNLGSAELGAIAPDAPYYHRFGRSSFEAVAEVIHGASGEDTYAVPRALFSSAGSDDAALAFAVGFLSHCVVDAVFHPMIYYFTGDYYHQDSEQRLLARRRHRALEVYLDHYWSRSMCDRKGPMLSVFQLSRRVAPHIQNHARALATALTSSDQTLWQESFRDLQLALRLCTNWWTGMLLTFFNRLVNRRFTGEQALLSFGRTKPIPWFSNRLLYKNPVTGRDVQQSLHELRDQARGTLLALCSEVEAFLRLDPLQRAQSKFAQRKGPSLNSGLEGSKKVDMRFFAPREID